MLVVILLPPSSLELLGTPHPVGRFSGLSSLHPPGGQAHHPTLFPLGWLPQPLSCLGRGGPSAQLTCAGPMALGTSHLPPPSEASVSRGPGQEATQRPQGPGCLGLSFSRYKVKGLDMFSLTLARFSVTACPLYPHSAEPLGIKELLSEVRKQVEVS